MNKDQMKGRTQAAAGKIKQVVGRAAGDTKLQVEGAAEKAAGKARARVGDARSDSTRINKGR